MSESLQATALKEQINKQNILKKLRDNRAKNMKRKSQATLMNPLVFSVPNRRETQGDIQQEERSPKQNQHSSITARLPLENQSNSREVQFDNTINHSMVHDTSMQQLELTEQQSLKPRKMASFLKLRQNSAQSPFHLQHSSSAQDGRALHSKNGEDPSSPRVLFGGINALENTRIPQGEDSDEEKGFSRSGKASRRLKKLLSQSMVGMSRQQQLQTPLPKGTETETASKQSLMSTIKQKLKLIFKKSKKLRSQSSSSSSSKEGEEDDLQKEEEEIKRRERVLKSVISKMTQIRDKNHRKSEELKNYIQTDIMAEDDGGRLSKKQTIESFVKALNLRKGVVIPEDHQLKYFWNFVVIASFAIASFVVPLDLAFDDFQFNMPISLVIYIIFTADIAVNMSTSFYHPEAGEIIKNPQVIRKYYFKSVGFAVDLLAVLPLQMVWETAPVNLTIFRLLKLFRLRPSQTLVVQSETAKLSMKIITLFFYLLLYLHFAACYFYSIIEKERVWSPPRSTFQGTDFYSSDLMTRYLTCFYTSIMILMGNDTKPETNSQVGVVCFLSITGALIIANVFGTITVVVSALNRKSQKFQEKIDMASTSMANMKLPPSIQQDIREFMMSTQNNLDTQKELDAFMQMISPSLRNQVTKHIFLNAIASNPVLQGSQDVIDFLINDVSTLLYLPEDRIINQGEHGGSLYLIAKGDCSVWVVDHMRQQRFVRQLNQGEYFGEVSIIYETPRTATVKSQNYCTLASLSSKTFFDLCNNFPEIIARMRERTLAYNDPWKQFKKKVLAQIDYFEKPKAEVEYFIEEVQYHLREEYFEKGTEIVGPDYPTKQIVFIVQGLVDLIVFDQEGNEVELDTLGQGSHIGQYSALFDEAPIFSAVAKTRVRVLTLSQEFFLENKDVIEGLEDAIFQCEDTVEEAGIPLCDYQKFFKQDNIKSKFLRARRKAHVLENSLSISQLISMNNDEPRKNSRVKLSNFSMEKSKPIMTRRDEMRRRWPPKRKAKRKRRGSIIVASTQQKNIPLPARKRRFTIAEPSQISRMLQKASMKNVLMLVPEKNSSSDQNSSEHSSSSSSSSSKESKVVDKKLTSVDSLSSQSSSQSSSSSEQPSIEESPPQKTILTPFASQEGRPPIQFQANNISDISEELKEEEKSSPDGYSNDHLHLYNSDYSSQKQSQVLSFSRPSQIIEPKSPSLRNLASAEDDAANSDRINNASPSRLHEEEKKEEPQPSLDKNQRRSSQNPKRASDIVTQRTKRRVNQPKSNISLKSHTQTSSGQSQQHHSQHGVVSSINVRGINEARMMNRRLSRRVMIKEVFDHYN